MAYSDFTLNKLKQEFNININQEVHLFSNITPCLISGLLCETLAENLPLALAIDTEKARSELIITPVLVELRKIQKHQISFFSGIEFNVDTKRGLNGVCDFIISQAENIYELTAPVIVMVEAKLEKIPKGLGQCIAEMLATQIFNQREKQPIDSVYGIVTTGNLWKFLKLTDNEVYIDLDEYHINQIKTIMGILVDIAKPA
ncbi:hypothetical protein QUF58_08080 [Anaerolineales bacterium HSG24]|nr:hypothetical protein [Anaerolineales bacterium HSG24]